jgi:hypothetical protein
MPRKKRYHPNGAIVWEGPSLIDNQPIALIVTGLFNPSCNPKTGVMHQTWILRTDVHPFEAIKNGKDISVCGGCGMKFDPDTLKRLCYVNPITLGQIYTSYLKDKYQPVTINSHSDVWFDLKPLRIGAYGDPAAVPIQVWIDWLDLLKALRIGWFLMASTFNAVEQQQAKDLGWQTYRVLEIGSALPALAVVCPGSEAGGYVKTCRECLMCRGAAATKDIVTYAHGGHSKFFKEVN